MLRVIALAALVALFPARTAAPSAPLVPSTPPPTALAWPRLVMFYGGELGDERRVIAVHEDVMRFMGDVSGAGDPARRTGPYVEVALYWYNPHWEPYAADPSSWATLPLPVFPYPGPPLPNMTEPTPFVQPARLWLGTATTPPIFDYHSALANPGPRVVGWAARDMVTELGLPISQVGGR